MTDDRKVWYRLTDADVELLKEKGKTYGDSWKRRGGTGAFMMLARKWDRIEKAAQEYNYDIFEAIKHVDFLVDDIIDLRCYLILCQAEDMITDSWKGEEPEPFGYVDQDGDPWKNMARRNSDKFKEYGIVFQDEYTPVEAEDLYQAIIKYERAVADNIPTRKFSLMMMSHPCVKYFNNPPKGERIAMPVRQEESCATCED